MYDHVDHLPSNFILHSLFIIVDYFVPHHWSLFHANLVTITLSCPALPTLIEHEVSQLNYVSWAYVKCQILCNSRDHHSGTGLRLTQFSLWPPHYCGGLHLQGSGVIIIEFSYVSAREWSEPTLPSMYNYLLSNI